jgi:hypothetical protein
VRVVEHPPGEVHLVGLGANELGDDPEGRSLGPPRTRCEPGEVQGDGVPVEREGRLGNDGEGVVGTLGPVADENAP